MILCCYAISLYLGSYHTVCFVVINTELLDCFWYSIGYLQKIKKT